MKTPHLPACFFIFIFTSFLYARTLPYPFVNWDDPVYVTKNAVIRSLTPENVGQMFFKAHYHPYTPLTLLSFAVDYQMFRQNPSGYRAVNISLHAANAVLVYAFVLLAAKDAFVALAAALLFGVHPVQTESVIWISERKSVLSSFFFFLALLAYGTSWKSEKSGARKRIAASFVFFLLACLAKPNVVVLPALLVLWDWSERRFRAGMIAGRYFLFGCAAVFFVILSAILLHSDGKARLPNAGGLAANFFSMLVVLLKYLELTFLPLKLSLLYDFSQYNSFFHPYVLASAFCLAALSAWMFLLWKKNRTRFFWAAWYFICLTPVLNIVPVSNFMNDRFLYLPMIGAFALTFDLLKKNAGIKFSAVMLGIMIAAFAVLNVKRQNAWATPETLWLETQNSTEGESATPYHNLGNQYLRQRRFDEAIEQFQKASKLNPKAETWGAIGVAYFYKGDLAAAENYIKKAIELNPTAPSFYGNLSLLYQKQGKMDEAVEFTKKAIDLAPHLPEHYSNLGALLISMQREAEAAAAFQKALELDPDFGNALFNLGTLYYLKNDAAGAFKYWERFLKVYPDSPRSKNLRRRMAEMTLNPGSMDAKQLDEKLKNAKLKTDYSVDSLQ